MAIQYIKNRKGTKFWVYAYKGGPQIHTHEGPRKPRKLPPEALRKLAEAEEARFAPNTSLLNYIIHQWRVSPEWKGLGDGTRRTWGRHLDMIEARWGEMPIGVWNDSRMTAKVVKWRNERADTPRTADIGVTVLVALLKWAKLNGLGITINVAADIPALYKGSDREDIIWLPEDIEAFCVAALQEDWPQFIDGIWLAALTGMRRADLVTLTFDHIGEFAVNKLALKKSRGKRRRAVIPMTPELEALLEELRGRYRAPGVNTVLVNSYGRPWSLDGFGSGFNRVRDSAGIVYRDEDGAERRKHLHDVRGTFCTMLLTECDLTDQEAAHIMAWSENRVANIRRKYVDDARVVVAIGERIANRRANQ